MQPLARIPFVHLVKNAVPLLFGVTTLGLRK